MNKTAPLSIIGRAATALALAMVAVPSFAADLDSEAGPPRLAAFSRPALSAKSQAILGGASSSLAAILQQQRSGTPVVQQASLPQPSASIVPAVAPRLEPAPMIRRAILPAHASKPNVFGSVALGVSRTPFDRRWAAVANAAVYGRDAAFATGLRHVREYDAIDAINRYVNARVIFTDDIVQFGTADRWLRASDTLAWGKGDCEDYAIAKMAMLKKAGFTDDDMYLVILKDLVRRADHAVLVVRTEGRFLVLDNGTNRLLDSDAVQDYRPILTYSAGKAWTHGYQRRELPPIIYASTPTYDGEQVAMNEALPVPAAARSNP